MSHRLQNPLLNLLTICLSCCVLVGCSHQPRSHIERTDISATVTNGGSPLAGALIDFSNPDSGEAYGGTLDAEGRVRLLGVAVGNYKITVQPPPGDPLSDTPSRVPQEDMQISRQFRASHLTPLQASVSDEKSDFAFELKDFDLSKKR
ncbi:carboxypeptidase-like regulatory domain-containing protein [Blastopirellula sp. J2-11]|uniref:carboxypeptidase-like regulatory domain-containing protein n=1 Tax=Blastopirellula sp. J2-11 TaxID=2943192 RepID=UPI0021C75466|nr:carboxypeptidase-like regulatory domain-containing protein [Blastopirellula sp. J2-11]UUO06019.1 carboxypeptidase-like regulatory domain-containing protein [Blastopirellula sp. J2-11]